MVNRESAKPSLRPLLACRVQLWSPASAKAKTKLCPAVATWDMKEIEKSKALGTWHWV